MLNVETNGKVALVTGANSGIGRVTARTLALQGYRVFLACRSEARTRPVLEEIRRLSQGTAQAEFLPLDLGDLGSVRRCAETFLERGLDLHLLIGNAGLAGQRGITPSGFELAFGTCHVGHFLLVAENRGYPAELQPLLDLGLAKGRIKAFNSTSSGNNLLSMISHGRLDYSLEYPVVVRHFTDGTALPTPLTTIPVTENILMSTAGLYCTRTPWGKDVATRLDRAIRQIVSNPEQLLPMYRKTVDRQVFDYYEPQLRAYLEERTQTPAEF